MAYFYPNAIGGVNQAPPDEPPDIAFLRALLDIVDDGPLLARLARYHELGRQGYSDHAMWRAYVATYQLESMGGTLNSLLRTLRNRSDLRVFLGFDPDPAKLPHRTTFGRYRQRLARHGRFIEQAIASGLYRLALLLPDFGQQVAVDGTMVKSYADQWSDPPTDPEASFGVSHKKSSPKKDGIQLIYGYKLHLMSCVKYGLPVAYKITTGKTSEPKQIKPLVEQAEKRLHGFHPTILTADKAYGTKSVWKFLTDKRINPVIPAKEPRKTKKGTRNLRKSAATGERIFTRDGAPTCSGAEMTYIRTDPDGRRLYRCERPVGHPKRGKVLNPSMCGKEYWVDPSLDYWLHGSIRRNSPYWKFSYRKRGDVERVFKTMQQGCRLDDHYLRGFQNVAWHILMALLVYVYTALVRVEAGDKDTMRWMVEKIE